MRLIPYYHVDVFTGELFAGNPAGVCILSAFLADRVMQKIAVENRHSNTAFVVARADGDFDLRWFTPKIEDDLCGHATLASAYVLALRKHEAWPVRFHTRSGVLSVAQDGDRFEMNFPARPAQPCEAPSGLLAALGLKRRWSRNRGITWWWSIGLSKCECSCPTLLRLPNWTSGSAAPSLLPRARATWTMCADSLLHRLALMRTPPLARFTARWLRIGRGGWVRTGCVRNNSVLGVDACSARSVVIE